MKMILLGHAVGKHSLLIYLTVGKAYEHAGAGFLDDNGDSRLVSSFAWKVLEAGEHQYNVDAPNYSDHISEEAYSGKLPDDDRSEPIMSKPLTKELKASDTMVGGDHYLRMGLQPLEATYLTYGYIGLKAAIFTKVMKYINRNKDNEVEQLKKARHCIDLLIEKAELENENNS